MSFVNEQTLRELPIMTHAELDALNFGVIQLDDEGLIEFYNQHQSKLADYEPAEVEGKNWFTQLALCTNNRLVYGKFTDGVAAGKLDHAIPYTFTYKMKPTLVNIHLYRDQASKTNWALVQKR